MRRPVDQLANQRRHLINRRDTMIQNILRTTDTTLVDVNRKEINHVNTILGDLDVRLCSDKKTQLITTSRRLTNRRNALVQAILKNPDSNFARELVKETNQQLTRVYAELTDLL